MKKALCLILSAATVLCLFASCGSTEEETTTAEETTVETTEAEYTEPAVPYMNINDEPYVVTCEDGYDNAGVTELLCDTDDTYVFTATGEATWSVYVLDEEFIDGARYLPQTENAALTGDGSLTIKNGQYVYVYCSCNAFTEDAPDDCSLAITRAETTAELATGEYDDETSQRATADVTFKDGKYEILVHWSSSATEATEWIMSASLEDGKLVYSDCQELTVIADENGETETTTEYENGTGYFEIADGKLAWTGAQDESCRDCVFSFAG